MRQALDSRQSNAIASADRVPGADGTGGQESVGAARDPRSCMPARRVNTRVLQTFIALLNAGSIAFVADRQRVSRATVLYQLHSLEDRVGTLFHVQSDGALCPTPLAVDMAPKVRGMLEIWAGLVGGGAGEPVVQASGSLRIGVSGLAELVAPHVLGHVRRMHPLMDAMLVPMATDAALIQALRRADIHLGLSLGADDAFQVVTDCVEMRCRMVPVCSRLRHAEFMAARVDAWPWLLEDSMPGLSADLGVWFRAVLAGGEPRVRAQSVGVLMDLLAAGLGVTLLPEVGLPGYLAERHLAVLEPAVPFMPPPSVHLCVVAPAAARRAAQPRALARDLYRVLVADVESGQGRQRDEPHPVR